ncbi:hypothetical protein AVEN_125238-1 [Araneus ventricosus]|uniref:Uncharacterized protein n=1 Tax=Araneus ventricosus TaxID=182803 RepID=A0A4Y2M6A2_ARAVE|nr:hypothetical protein AVEN_125238-1 [Araneus ventricosus]
MAVIAFTENVEFADWVDEDDIDIRGLTIPEDESDVKIAVYSTNEHISSPWEEESPTNKVDIWWNQVSKLEPSDAEAQVLPPGHSTSETVPEVNRLLISSITVMYFSIA